MEGRHRELVEAARRYFDALDEDREPDRLMAEKHLRELVGRRVRPDE